MDFNGDSKRLLESLLNNYDVDEPWTGGSDRASAFETFAGRLRAKLKTARRQCYEADVHRTTPVKFESYRGTKTPPTSSLIAAVPQHIRKDLLSEATSSAGYTWDINGRPVTMTIVFYDDGDAPPRSSSWVRKATMAQTLVRLLMPVAGTACSNTLDIVIYLHPAKRSLPDSAITALGPTHVNGGVATACSADGVICVYREEEWLKVLIHELFHALGLDNGGHEDVTGHQEMDQLFPLENASANLAETYSETWARILNAAVVCCAHPDAVTEADFSAMLEMTLGMERIFALWQTRKVLGHMGLSLRSLYATDTSSCAARRLLYRENTPVLSYYILTGLVMRSLPSFLVRAMSENVDLFRLQSRAAPLKIVTDAVHEAIADPSLLTRIGTLENTNRDPWVETTTRMSIIEN
jgi:hypothetical protein